MVKKRRFLSGSFLICLLAVAFSLTPAFSQGDTRVYARTYTDSSGNSCVFLTNSAAQNLSRYFRVRAISSWGGRTLTTQRQDSENENAMKAPFANFDVSFRRNADRILESIYVSGIRGGGTYYMINITPIIMEEARKNDLDPLLIKTVIRYESAFNACAVSPAGAMGLMQLMPGTAAFLGVTDCFDPYQNIAGGVSYLRQQMDRFGNVALALAAYNAGPANVSLYLGIPPFAETQNYVYSILSEYCRFARVKPKTRVALATNTRKESAGSLPPPPSPAPASPAPTVYATTSIAVSPGYEGPAIPPANPLENNITVSGNPLENRPSARLPGL